MTNFYNDYYHVAHTGFFKNVQMKGECAILDELLTD